ncbi:MAG: AAA family ATPase [Dehalococcoidales bacterium]|nr:AAA family ATPase [Dehalococcoidales bacterium]
MTAKYPEIVEALLDATIYPDKTYSVELVQTQTSFVFLTGEYVYKVKKPVNLGYLDYTTLEKRLFFCRRELELNQRLCPETYLAVIPIMKNEGTIALSGDGEIIDYAVKMRQLPRERMLNELIAKDRIPDDTPIRVAQKLAEFHKKAETGDAINVFGSPDTIMFNTDENFRETEKYIGITITAEKFRRIKDFTNRFIADNVSLFQKRVTGGKIRDCHGDLHAAHICVTDGICIYDCIEFNERFRYGDVASEVAFLAMDLDHYGRADLSRSFVEAYVESSGDREILRLLNFYECYRAYVRGKVESFKFDDPYISEAERVKTRDIAASYFDLAGFYTRHRPALFITVGLVGTGKSVIANSLAKRLGTVVISSDAVRKTLAGIPLTEHRFNEFNSGIYTKEFSRKTYDTLFARAGEYLSKGMSVILDATFILAEGRRTAMKLAQEKGADFFVLECTLADDLVKQRLARRLEKGTVSDARWETYESQKKIFEPVVEVPANNHAIMETSKPVPENVRQVMEMIGE